MKTTLLSFVALLSLGATAAPVALTFDTDLESFTQGGSTNGGSIQAAWSSFNGGSMELSFDAGWRNAIAYLDIGSNAPMFAEFQSALVNGGTISYDIYVNTNEILGGAPGWFEPMYIGNSSAGWDQTYGGGKGQPTLYGSGSFPASTILHFTVNYPIEAAASVINDDRAQFGAASGWNQINLGINCGGGDFTSGKFYVDNFTITSNAIPVVVPPPTTTLKTPTAGLNLISSGPGQYDRQNLRTTTPQHSWVGATGPVTYSVTLREYATLPFHQTVIYLVPGTGLATGVTFPDYSQPVCLSATIGNNSDGSGYLNFAYKNDVANSNGAAGHEYWVDDNPADLYDGIVGAGAAGTGKGGRIATLSSTTILGTWSITFTSNTGFTLTAPDGNTSVGTLPNEATAQLFANPLYAYFGTNPGETANIGQSVVVSDISITGTASPITTGIAAALTGGVLEVSASNAPGIVNIAPGAASFWFTWTLPATDFSLQTTTVLQEDQWQNVDTAGAIGSGSTRTMLLQPALSTDTQAFYRMFKP